MQQEQVATQEAPEKVDVISVEDRDKNFERLVAIVQSVGLQDNMRRMLVAMRNNRSCVKQVGSDEQVEYLGFRDAPAGKGVHHAYKGGLVQHLLEMWDYWKLIEPTIPRDQDIGPYSKDVIYDASVLTGIIMHDLSKAWFTFVESDKNPSGVDYGNHPSASMMTNNIKSLHIANSFGVQLNGWDLNVLECSEGGWSKAPPKFQSTLAKMVYILDELSSNVLARTRTDNHFDVRNQGFVPVSVLDPLGD